ncbi:MAG: threonine--tRNA ligase, partial [Alphaproteobacteria bacterium]|nr:threonine--tRNA ligase [Alphaproteobacteria bacterium]
IRSFRDLPMRYFEFGAVHRSEPSGALHGLFRTRGFVQDDAHVFCREDQIEAEVRRFCEIQTALYADFGFHEVQVRFSTRPEARAGSDAVWDRAEQALEAAARAAGLMPIVQPGEGAFYGPKLEFHLKDRLGRWWQCGTVQLDFVLPERLGAVYHDQANDLVRPVILHHAVLGSLERFIGVLLEHHDGHLPAWLAPEQVLVASINKEAAPYARRIEQALADAGLRVALDEGPDSLPRKIVDARDRAIPMIAVIGKRESRERTVALRHRDGRQEMLPQAAAIARIADLAACPGG